jgi:hypothetical protein
MRYLCPGFAAARELRDRWLEHVNSGLATIESAGKYDLTWAIENSVVTSPILKALQGRGMSYNRVVTPSSPSRLAAECPICRGEYKPLISGNADGRCELRLRCPCGYHEPQSEQYLSLGRCRRRASR